MMRVLFFIFEKKKRCVNNTNNIGGMYHAQSKAYTYIILLNITFNYAFYYWYLFFTCSLSSTTVILITCFEEEE